MAALGSGVRVRVAASQAEARKLCARLQRGGIPAAPDDGTSRAEILVVSEPADLAPFRSRAGWLVVLGAPGARYFAAGADEVVVPGEPEMLFRRLRMLLERRDMVARLERLNERVEALEAGLADAAHDVRSPLQVVIGNSELLARDTSLTPKQRERTVVDARASDVGKLVETAVEHAQPAARQRGVTLVANPPPRSLELRADPDLLSRLLDNLIANAVRASPRGGQVEVSGWRSSPKLVRFAVKDAGDGIPASELSKLVAGLGPGRGLRIAREIAERHGGDLWAESSIGNGSRFFVELPLAPPSSRPKVLLISDDTKWLREIARTLKSACDVRTAATAGARLGNKQVDLVLVDPAKSHGKKLDALRNEAKDAQVPVVELPSESAAARLARTLAHLAP